MIAPTTTPAAAAGRAWDAVVVGAGPAGSLAARELARRGRSVLLLDKATFPRGKVCGCCVNQSALATLSGVGLGELVAKCGAIPLGGVRLAARGRSAEVRLPGGVAVSREAFDAALVREAIAAGVEWLPGVSGRSDGAALHLTPQPPSLRGKGEPNQEPSSSPPPLGEGPGEGLRLRPHVVVLASGLNAAAATVAARSRIGAGVVAPHAPAFYRPGTIFMAVGRGGYVGLVRLEDGRLDLAAAFDPGFVRTSAGLGPAAALTLADAGFPAVPDVDALPWRGTPALTRTAQHIAGPGWFAVGDAAGYVEPFTGEGMAWAMASAVAVAPLAERAIAGEPNLAAEWEVTHARTVRGRQQVCRTAAKVLRSPLLSRLAVAALARAPVLARPVVAALNRPPVLATEPAA